MWPHWWVCSLLLSIVPTLFRSGGLHPAHGIVPKWNIYSKTVKRKLTIIKGAIHTSPALTYFPTQLLDLGNWFLNLLLAFWAQKMQMAGGKVFLADIATAVVSTVKMVNNPMGVWKLSIFQCMSQVLSSYDLWLQRVLHHFFAGFTWSSLSRCHKVTPFPLD